MKLRRRKQHHGGFTLLELMMVVIIIAILASLALPQYIRASEKARAAEAFQTLAGVRSSEIRYRAQDPLNQYTTNANKLDFDIPNSTLWTPLGIGAGGSGNTSVGGALLTRNGGIYSGQTVGLSFGTGTICGTFVPIAPVNTTCTSD